jgi:phosphopantetheine adenylyltransferase
MAHFGPKQEMEYQRRRDLQREVLEHLKQHSPKKWDQLCVHFAFERNANIQPLLHVLKEARDIEVGKGKDQMVSITDSGLTRLEETNY